MHPLRVVQEAFSFGMGNQACIHVLAKFGREVFPNLELAKTLESLELGF